MPKIYDSDGIVLYQDDCRQIFKELPVGDLYITDPPYPDFNDDHGRDWEITPITDFEWPAIRSFFFWPIKAEFPFKWTGRHVWHKPNGQSEYHYEFIYETNGDKACRVFRVPIINYKTLPEWTPHPTQKPMKLIKQLILLGSKPGDLIIDPFVGSGTTLVAAKELGRKAIGIEVNIDYCDMTLGRLSQSVMSFYSIEKPVTKKLFEIKKGNK